MQNKSLRFIRTKISMPESGEGIPYKSMQFWMHVYYCKAIYFSKSLKISIQQLKSKEVQKWERYHTHTHTHQAPRSSSAAFLLLFLESICSYWNSEPDLTCSAFAHLENRRVHSRKYGKSLRGYRRQSPSTLCLFFLIRIFLLHSFLLF